MKITWKVTVGNVGTVYAGPTARIARDTYADYVGILEAGSGRYGRAEYPVTLWRNDDIEKEATEPNTRNGIWVELMGPGGLTFHNVSPGHDAIELGSLDGYKAITVTVDGRPVFSARDYDA